MMSYNNATQQYKEVGAFSGTAYADPHRLIQMLMQGGIDKVAMAKCALNDENIGVKGECISKAISIIDGLRASLDKETGGEIAVNLDDLYDYMQRVLVEGNLHNDIAKLDEVISLLTEIRDAWDTIPVEVREEYANKAAT